MLSGGFSYRTLKDFPEAHAVVEDAETFAGNATKKALELARWLSARQFATRGPGAGELDGKAQPIPESLCLADDSGLEMDALAGAPGVHSARFAALDASGAPSLTNSSDQDNNAKLLRLLAGVPKERRTARFRCVIAVTPVLLSGPQNNSAVCNTDEAELRTQIFEGVCEGRIIANPRGSNGFGYDPLFVPNDFDESFAELGEEVKNRISHRARALMELRRSLRREL